MSQSRAELLDENMTLRQDNEHLRAAIVLWRDLYEVIAAQCAEAGAQPRDEASVLSPTNQQLATVEVCGPGFQHLAAICIEEGLSLKATTRIADCVRTMQTTVLSDAAQLFTDAAATTDGLSK